MRIRNFICLHGRVGQVARRHASFHSSLTNLEFKSASGHGQPSRPSLRGRYIGVAEMLSGDINVEECGGAESPNTRT
jgi:hypothetical protein